MIDAQSKSPHRRRWFQFSLRKFLVLMILSSLGLGWLGTAIQRGRERRKAVLAIVELGGVVNYREPSSFLQRNDWLRKSLGDELLLDVEAVGLEFAKISDADLVHLKELTQLECLDLNNTQVSDAGLIHLKGLTKLEWLFLSNTQTSVKGVAKLQKALPNCRIHFNSTMQTRSPRTSPDARHGSSTKEHRPMPSGRKFDGKGEPRLNRRTGDETESARLVESQNDSVIS